MSKRILVLGDSHHPDADFNVLEQARVFAKEHKVTHVVSTGDMLDQKAWSRYPKSPEDDSPELEWEKAVKACLEMSKMFPNMVILNSNHDRRYIKKASEAGLPKAMIRTLDELIPVKGWKWHLGPSPFIIDNIAFMHGDELQGSVEAKATRLGMNVVQGHTHKAELKYVCTFDKRLFGLDVGCTINPNGRSFDYASSSITKVWVGFGYIEAGVPHLIPKKFK